MEAILNNNDCFLMCTSYRCMCIEQVDSIKILGAEQSVLMFIILRINGNLLKKELRNQNDRQKRKTDKKKGVILHLFPWWEKQKKEFPNKTT